MRFSFGQYSEAGLKFFGKILKIYFFGKFKIKRILGIVLKIEKKKDFCENLKSWFFREIVKIEKIYFFCKIETKKDFCEKSKILIFLEKFF